MKALSYDRVSHKLMLTRSGYAPLGGRLARAMCSTRTTWHNLREDPSMTPAKRRRVSSQARTVHTGRHHAGNGHSTCSQEARAWNARLAHLACLYRGSLCSQAAHTPSAEVGHDGGAEAPAATGAGTQASTSNARHALKLAQVTQYVPRCGAGKSSCGGTRMSALWDHTCRCTSTRFGEARALCNVKSNYLI